MKQRTRIRKMKAHLYPRWIYAARRRKMIAEWRAAGVKISDALREAYVVAMMGASALHIDDRTIWALALDSAITSVAQGKASQQQWSCIFAAAALLEDLVKAGKVRATQVKLSAALREAYERARA